MPYRSDEHDSDESDIGFRISSYRLEVRTGKAQPAETGSPAPFRAQIWLYDWAAHERRAVIRFFESHTFPSDHQAPDGLLVLHMPLPAMTTVVDILRHDPRVYLRWRNGEPARLSTRQEPVGTAERG